MAYVVAFRTPRGAYTKYRSTYQSVDDAIDACHDKSILSTNIEWVREADGAWCELSDGSIVSIFKE